MTRRVHFARRLLDETRAAARRRSRSRPASRGERRLRAAIQRTFRRAAVGSCAAGRRRAPDGASRAARAGAGAVRRRAAARVPRRARDPRRRGGGRRDVPPHAALDGRSPAMSRSRTHGGRPGRPRHARARAAGGPARRGPRASRGCSISTPTRPRSRRTSRPIRCFAPALPRRACACRGRGTRSRLLVRAMLGQQVSVAAARTLAGRLVRGVRHPARARPSAALTHLFPEPAGARGRAARSARPDARTRRRAARRRAPRSPAAALDLDDLSAISTMPVERLAREPGIGAWTAQYVASCARCASPMRFPQATWACAGRSPRGGALPHGARRARTRRSLAALACLRHDGAVVTRCRKPAALRRTR